MDLLFGGDSGPILAASLELAGRAGTPGVVLVGGSGPSDRTNGGFFTPIIERLIASGIAVLSYDKRGVGRSQGSWHDASVDDLARAALAAVSALRARSEVDSERVTVFGHSEGGWVAWRACRLGARPHRVIANSCPAVSFVHAEVHALLSSGVSTEAAISAGTVLDTLGRVSVGGSSLAAGADAVREPSMTIGAAALAEAGFVLDATTWAQLRAWGRYDPTPDLNALAVPGMSLFGAADALVPVVESSAALTRSAVSANRRQAVHVFPRAGHRLVDSDTGAFPADYLDTVSGWITHS
jgi:hypothetical protein